VYVVEEQLRNSTEARCHQTPRVNVSSTMVIRDMSDEPRAVLAVILWGVPLTRRGGQRTALCQGGVLAARSIGPKVTRLVRCGSGETKDKNFLPTFLTFLTRRWRRGRSRRSRKSGHICLNILVVGAFLKNSSIGLARRETTKCVWEIGSFCDARAQCWGSNLRAFERSSFGATTSASSPLLR
jgi:hypothetical protein